MTRNAISILVAGLFALVILLGSIYTVDQRQSAIVFQLGEVVETVETPGLHFKLPLAQNVRFFDRRILTLDTPEPERYITSEKKNVLVDSYVKWRIKDVRQFYISVNGDETRAATRLSQTINSSLRDEFGSRTVREVVSGERDRITVAMRETANAEAQKIGVEVVDVRIKRVELPSEVSESVFRRMEAERKRVANELRSTGAAESERIRADADKQREVILAEAYREAQRIKGVGDARSAEIYGRAYGADGEFYAFYRSLEAYRSSFKDRSDMLVLDPSSDFFKYMKKSGR
ncbi:MAG: protease modulator HflC [Burkholderiales bacterium]|nr:protease modulator HflC [Burkholderiales bacterium]